MSTFVTNNSSAVTISGSVSTSATLQAPAASQTLVTKNYLGTVQNGSAVTLHTVTAGKTFYCTGFLIQSGGTVGNYRIYSDATCVARGATGSTTYTMSGLAGSVFFSTAATKTVTIDLESGGPTTGCNVSIWGYEQ